MFVFGSWIASFFAGSAEMTGNAVAGKGLAGMITSLMMPIAIIFAIFGVVGIFVAKGVFNGAKWAIITNIVLGSLGVLFNIGNVFGSDMPNPEVMMEANSHGGNPLLTLIINVAVIILGVMCYKHPFYNQEKS